MANNIIKSFSEISKVSEAEVERLWKKAEKIVSKQYDIDQNNKKYYKLVVVILKRMLEIDEEITVDSSGLNAGIPVGGAGMGVAIKTTKKKKKKLITFREYLEI